MDTKFIVEQFLLFLSQRDLNKLAPLFSDQVDWDIPGDVTRAKWLGRRKTRGEIENALTQLWSSTQPQTATVTNIFIDGPEAVITGKFSTKMVPTNKVVDSIFFIHLVVGNGQIVKYRLLEDSFAVSMSLV